jgi:site-specific recombinase XerD
MANKPLTLTAIENIVTKYFTLAGITPGARVLSPHALRHTAFSVMSSKGIPIAVIKYIAGHESIETTGIYMHHRQDYEDNIGFHHPFNQ